MSTVVIKTKGKADLRFWLDLAKKTGNTAATVDMEDFEDFAFGKLMTKNRKSRTLTEKEQADFLSRLKKDAGK